MRFLTLNFVFLKLKLLNLIGLIEERNSTLKTTVQIEHHTTHFTKSLPKWTKEQLQFLDLVLFSAEKAKHTFKLQLTMLYNTPLSMISLFIIQTFSHSKKDKEKTVI